MATNMNKFIIILVVVSYEVYGRSRENERSSLGGRDVILEASDIKSEGRVRNLKNWDSDRIWFPDFDEKQFSTRATSTKPTKVVTPVPSTNINECIRQCPKTSEYNPVCGTDRVTYSNVGKLECARSCGVAVVLLRKLPCSLVFQEVSTTKVTETLEDEQRRCIESCPKTPEYNPICGTNNVTYNNIGTLECAKFCGVVVNVRRLSPCPRPIRTSAVSPDNLDALNDIFNSPAADPVEDDIDIRLRG